MRTVRKILPILLLVCCIASDLFAGGRFALGPEVGFSYLSHRDPTGRHLAWAPGLPFGVSGIYEFNGDLNRLALTYSIGYSWIPRLTYRKVTIGAINGTYRESLGVFHWLFGARYYFGRSPWRPFAGMDVGFEYFRRGSLEFRNQFNTLLPTPPHSNQLNLTLSPQFGIEYRPTFRWAFGISLKTPLAIRGSGIVPGFAIPLSVHFAF